VCFGAELLDGTQKVTNAWTYYTDQSGDDVIREDLPIVCGQSQQAPELQSTFFSRHTTSL
jgi:hypothetical protein